MNSKLNNKVVIENSLIMVVNSGKYQINEQQIEQQVNNK